MQLAPAPTVSEGSDMKGTADVGSGCLPSFVGVGLALELNAGEFWHSIKQVPEPSGNLSRIVSPGDGTAEVSQTVGVIGIGQGQSPEVCVLWQRIRPELT